MTILFNSKTPQYAWLSNFSRCDLPFNGTAWSSAEHAYQAMKFEGSWQYESIRKAKSAYEAKQLSKMPGCAPDWNTRKFDIMRSIIHAKFSLPQLRKQLQATAPEPLVHLSPWDGYWGSGRDGKGANHLGLILMAERNL